MKNWTDESRARIARGWPESGLTQPAYAEQNGISPRTLRTWLRTYVPTRQPPSDAVRSVVVEAIEKLQAVLDELDRAAAEAEQGRGLNTEDRDDQFDIGDRADTPPDVEEGAGGEKAGHGQPLPASSDPPPPQWSEPVKLAPPRRVGSIGKGNFFSEF